ncbi:MAG: 1,2-phenylacetyl-CoA epoxidase subunit PaaC [Actinomycetota bacterium]|nr:phenylacetate-CoA oxygenase subunit PaaC [Actinomycetota bacterium]
MTQPLGSVLLALADDELIIGHRHSEWTGWAPHIEEDIAFSSIAQDEIGHANLFYSLLADVEGTTADQLAFARQPADYTNAIICERSNGDWAFTIARHFLYEIAERIRLEALSKSSHDPLAQVCEKLLREERYHELHATAWFKRLATGPVEGRHQMAMALSETLADAAGLFEPFSAESDALSQGILPVASFELMATWLEEAMSLIESEGLPVTIKEASDNTNFLPTSSGELTTTPDNSEIDQPKLVRDGGRWLLTGNLTGMGGRKGHHSPEFMSLWDDLTKTYREEPSATW